MYALIDFSLKHTRTILSLFAFIIIAGFVAYKTIPKESLPDAKVPIIFVTVPCRGILPNDSERLILKPLEQKLRSVEGLKELNSTAYEGGATVVLEFFAGHDIDKAKEDVKDQVDEAKSDLPKDINEPVIKQIDLSLLPILVIKLSGNVSERYLYKTARDLKDKIESEVPTVLKAGIVGDKCEQVNIEISPDKLENYHLPIDAVLNNFSSNNRLISAGAIDNNVGRFQVKVPGLLTTVKDIMESPILWNEQSVITLQDIAQIKRTFEDPESFARDRGENAVAIEITKRVGENIIETVKGVRKVVTAEQKNWPPSLKISFSQDQSKKILDMLSELQNSLVLSVILVMIVMFASLGWKSALLVSLAVPGSFLSGILFLSFSGYTLNMMVLFGLIFAVGMLVDGAIIVVEYADRKMEEGLPAYEAYKFAANRMAWPVVTSISTILMVFLPLLFWPGFIGKIMKFLPITLLATLTASIIMAIVFVPCLGVFFMSFQKKPRHSEEFNYETDDLSKLTGFVKFYINILTKALEKPVKIITIACCLLVLVISIYKIFGRGTEFFPNVEPENLVVHVHARGNLSVYEKDRLVKEVEKKLVPMKELESIYTKAGSMRAANEKSGSLNLSSGEDEIGNIMIELADWQTRRKAEAIITDIEKACDTISGVKIIIEKEKKGPPNKAVRIDVLSGDYNSIYKETARIKKFMNSLESVTALQDNMPVPGIEWQFNINRSEAAKYEANVSIVGLAVQLITTGVKIGSFRPDDSPDEIDIMARFPSENRFVDELDRLKVQTKSGLMPVSNFVKREIGKSVTTYKRVDGCPAVRIESGIKEGFLANDVLKEIKTFLEKNPPDKGIAVEFKGDAKDQSETFVFLVKAFSISIALMLMVMLTEFNSFFSTFLVLSAVIMSTIGVFLGLFLRNMPFGVVMCGIGIIGLAGVIVSNNIILIDTYDHFCETISDAKERILRAGAQRLRPVILTKLTVVLGLLPVMFGINVDFFKFEITIGAPSSHWWMQLATCIVSGVSFASVLTLIVTPCALMVRENYKAKKLFKPSK